MGAVRRPRVAVIDDDEEFVAMMEVLLEEEDMEFVKVPLGRAAVEGLVAAHADAAILDLRGVADDGGIELLRRFRADARLAQLPVLLCSADIQLLRNAAADLATMPRVASIEKPFRIDALVGTLSRLIAGVSAYPTVAAGTPDASAVAALEELLAHVGVELGWSVTDAWVPDARPGLLRCAATWLTDAALEPFVAVSRRIRLPYGGGLPGRVWASARPVWSDELERDMNFPRLPVAHSVGLVSAAGVPVMDGDAVVGVIAGYATTPRPEDPAAIDRMQAVTADAIDVLRGAAGMTLRR